MKALGTGLGGVGRRGGGCRRQIGRAHLEIPDLQPAGPKRSASAAGTCFLPPTPNYGPRGRVVVGRGLEARAPRATVSYP